MRITFAGPLISTFVKNDVTILQSAHDVHSIDVALGKGRSAAARLLTLHVRIILSLLRSDALFFWFADYYTLLPTLIARLLRKPVFVVAGGFDVTYLPELGIGARTRPVRWFAVKQTFRFASHIFPVSQDTLHDLDHAVPDHASATMIYNAVDTKTYHYEVRQRERVALTVSQADSLPEYKRKGIDLFISLASRLPDIQFRVVGLRGSVVEQARKDAEGSSNIAVIPGRVPLPELLEEFWTASVYCQFSIEERFGVSVAEAMSCGCVPVVTPVNALKEVVDSFGMIVDRAQLDQLASSVELAMATPDERRLAISRSIARFDINSRGKQLLDVVSQYLNH